MELQGITLLDTAPTTGYDAGMSKRRTDKLSDQLRQAIDDSGLTRYQISKATGIDQSVLSKFHHGERGISLAAVDQIGEYLGLRIVKGRRRKLKGR
jgi:transcriptional regulator with XRE-family HTH domain